MQYQCRRSSRPGEMGDASVDGENGGRFAQPRCEGSEAGGLQNRKASGCVGASDEVIVSLDISRPPS